MIKKYILLLLSVFSLGFSCIFTFESLAASGKLTGPEMVYAGDTIEVSFYLNGDNIYGISGSLAYDDNVLYLQEPILNIGSTWKLEFHDTKFLAYDDQISNPLSGEVAIFTLVFSVKEDVTTNEIQISLNNILASDGTKDNSVGTVTYYSKIEKKTSENFEDQDKKDYVNDAPDEIEDLVNTESSDASNTEQESEDALIQLQETTDNENVNPGEVQDCIDTQLVNEEDEKTSMGLMVFGILGILVVGMIIGIFVGKKLV